ncbi:hypothetical protein [Streptosporangium roseum]
MVTSGAAGVAGGQCDLKAEAWDKAGNTIKQTSIHVFGLRR